MIQPLGAEGAEVMVQQQLVLHDAVDDAAAQCRIGAGDAVPLQLGLQFGPLRLFGGAQFRVADSERDSAPKLLKVNFNDDVGIMGGVGFNIRKFFFDFRLSRYARSHVWNTFVSDGVSQRVRVPRNLVYGGSVGFFF